MGFLIKDEFYKEHRFVPLGLNGFKKDLKGCLRRRKTKRMTIHFAWRGGSIGVNLEAGKLKIFARSNCFAILSPIKFWFDGDFTQSFSHPIIH
jgi:hypothetical protein